MPILSNYVRWATNTEELRQNLKAGLDQIEATRAGAEKMVQALGGDKLIAAAHRMAAAIQEVGGVTKLTAAEQERANVLIEKALEKYRVLGQQAPLALRQLAEATKKVPTDQLAVDTERLAKQFTTTSTSAQAYVAAIQRIGGAAKLTEAEQKAVNAVLTEALAKYRALGQQAPPAMQALADATKQAGQQGSFLASTFGQVFAGFTAANLMNRAVSTLTDLGRQALETAGQLVDLSNKTGLSTETIQRMQFVAKQSGSDMGTFADAVFKMGVNISEGTKKARDGAEALGLSWQDLRAASPDAQFNMVVQALERMEDPQKRNEAAVALFGKTAKEILPAIVDGYTKVANEATVAGDAQVRALDAAGDAWDRFKQRTTTGAVNALGSIVLLREASAGLTDDEKAFVLQTMQGEKSIEAYDAALIRFYLAKQKAKDIPLAPDKSAVPPSFIADLKAAEAGYAALTTVQRTELFTAIQLNKSNDEIINSLNITEGVLAVGKKAYADHTQAITKAAAAQKDWNALLGEFASVGGTTQETLAGIDGSVLAGTQYYIARGVELDKIAKLYGLTKEQVEAVAAQMKFEQSVLDATNKAFNTHLPLVGLLTARYGALHDSLHTLVSTSNEFHDGITIAGDTMATVTIPMFSTLPNVVPQGTKAIKDATAAVKGFGETLKTGFGRSLGGMNDVFMRAFEGGGGLVGAGKSLATSLTSAALSAIPAIGPILGQFSGAIVAGFSKLFGGASAEEKKGRETVQAFEAQIASTLTTAQKAEAGGDAWKMTIIGVRDAYLKTGHSAAEAEAATQRLWASSKGSAAEQKAAIAEINKALDLEKQALEALPGILKDVSGGMNAISKGTVGLANEAAAAIDKTKEGSEEGFIKIRESGREEFDRTGRLAVSAFNAAIAGGKSFGEAMTELGPTFDDLTKAQGTFGFTTTASLQELLNFKSFAAGPGKEVLSTLDGVNKMMGGLQKLGLLTQDDFNDLAGIATDTFGKMTAGGVSGSQALRAMQPTLQKLWELHHDQGLAIDENTSKILTEAEQQGLVGDKLREPQERMLRVLEAIAKALGAELPEAAEKGAKGVNDALDKIPDHKDVTVSTHYDDGTYPHAEPSFAARGGFVRAVGVQHFDVGGWVKASGWREPWTVAKRGSDTVPAMLTPGELILNQGQQAQIASLLEKGAQAAQGVLAGGKQAPIVMQEQLTVNLTVQSLDPRGVPEIVEQQMMPEITKQLEDRRRGYTARWQQALSST